MPGDRAGKRVGSSRPPDAIVPNDQERRPGRPQTSGDDHMTFVILKKYDDYVIVNDDADFIVGNVYPRNGQEGPYRVTADVGPLGRETSKPVPSTR
jgi:hypothetical protein